MILSEVTALLKGFVTFSTFVQFFPTMFFFLLFYEFCDFFVSQLKALPHSLHW